MNEIIVRKGKSSDIDGIFALVQEFAPSYEPQKDKFQNLCDKLDLTSVSPLWDSDPKQYLEDLISTNFDFIITSCT